MQSLKFCGFDIPLTLVSAVSYGVNARTMPNWYGEVRFLGLENSEISIRLTVSFPVAYPTGHDVAYWWDVLSRITCDVKTQSQVFIGNDCILPHLQFAITSVNETVERDVNGTVVAFERDVTLSGVAVSERVPSETRTGFVPLPVIEIESNGKALTVGQDVVVSDMIETGFNLSLSLVIGDDTDVATRSWLATLARHPSTVRVGTRSFHIVDVGKTDNDLSIEATAFDAEYLSESVRSYSDAHLSTVFKGFDCTRVRHSIGYYLRRGTLQDMLYDCQSAFGLIINPQAKIISEVPTVLKATVPKVVSVSQDEMTAQITGIIWRDGVNEYRAGDQSNAVVLNSSVRCDSAAVADVALRWMRFQQNSIVLDMVLTDEIKLNSVITLEFPRSTVTAMVTDYTKDWISGTMTAECHYL